MDNKAIQTPLFIFLCITLFLKSCTSLGADTISEGQSLYGDQTISSANFELGFFQPGNSRNYYLGTWYKGVKQTVIWVANREKPFVDRFSTRLSIVNGSLVLSDESRNSILWSTNTTRSKRSSGSVRAVIEDNGNFVLRHGVGNGSEPVWQSYDHPTDTWMPEGKIGFNKRTGERYSFTSWKNPDDPSPGLFSFDPARNDNVVLWNNSVQYWSTGSWDPNDRVFNNIPEMKANHDYYTFTFVSNENESYYTYVVNNGEFSRFVMDVNGQMKQLILNNQNKEWNTYWTQPRQQCQVHSYCGPYGSCNEINPSPFCTCLTGFQPKVSSDWDSKNYLAGCVRQTSLTCSGGLTNTTSGGVPAKDRFFRMASVLLPEKSLPVGAGNETACESLCLNDCSCTAYSFSSSNGGCSIWTADLVNLQQLAGGDERGRVIHIRLAASELIEIRRKHRNVRLVAGAAVAGSVVVLLFVAVLFFVARRGFGRKNAKGVEAMEGSLVAFGYRDLQNATRNFSEKLGGGGFGSVFKGMLPESKLAVAVKKLESVSQGEKEFRMEVATVGAIQHVNLVRLRGFCSEKNYMLVYEYMSNGSLSSHLFAKDDSDVVLDWRTRYQIALGTARGLMYLHEECRNCIIHCDIKPENILLDENFSPKVADFGLAKLVGRDFSRVLTTIRGTIGYLAPEWIAGVAVTPKADVYSYGMMLFEMVSGKRNSENAEQRESRMKYFPSVAARAVVEGDGGGEVMGLLDPRLEGDADVAEVERVCRLACWCIQDDESQRPTMGQVVKILEGILEVNLPPIPRSLHIFDAN